MTDQQQRTQWALDLFAGFIRQWTPAAMHEHLTDRIPSDGENVRAAIRAIAPKDGNPPIGWAVFQRHIDTGYDIRQHPSGYLHTLTSAFFDKPAHAENAHQGASKRHPENQYVICEIREVP
jgi:hypothetical protein